MRAKEFVPTVTKYGATLKTYRARLRLKGGIPPLTYIQYADTQVMARDATMAARIIKNQYCGRPYDCNIIVGTPREVKP